MIELIKKLSENRPVFHSEFDFQHELAMLIKTEWKPQKIRLEKPINLQDHIQDNKLELDIFLEVAKNEKVGIELKYKTKEDTIIKLV